MSAARARVWRVITAGALLVAPGCVARGGWYGGGPPGGAPSGGMGSGLTAGGPDGGIGSAGPTGTNELTPATYGMALGMYETTLDEHPSDPRTPDLRERIRVLRTRLAQRSDPAAAIGYSDPLLPALGELHQAMQPFFR